jgi:hypothetical protein
MAAHGNNAALSNTAMTHNGKIARLPLAIRQQLNLRLQNGEMAQDLLSGLNSLPEVQAILAAHFAAKPIDESNLSHWKQGGYREWEAQEHAQAAALAFLEAQPSEPQVPAGALSERLRAFCATLLVAETLRVAALEESLEERDRWNLLFSQMALLCQADRATDWVQLQREQLELQRENSRSARERQFQDWAKKDENRAAFGIQRQLTEQEKQERIRQIMGIGPEYGPDAAPESLLPPKPQPN